MLVSCKITMKQGTTGQIPVRIDDTTHNHKALGLGCGPEHFFCREGEKKKKSVSSLKKFSPVFAHARVQLLKSTTVNEVLCLMASANAIAPTSPI